MKPKERAGAAKQGVLHGPWMYNGELGTTYQQGGKAYPAAQYCHGTCVCNRKRSSALEGCTHTHRHTSAFDS